MFCSKFILFFILWLFLSFLLYCIQILFLLFRYSFNFLLFIKPNSLPPTVFLFTLSPATNAHAKFSLTSTSHQTLERRKKKPTTDKLTVFFSSFVITFALSVCLLRRPDVTICKEKQPRRYLISSFSPSLRLQSPHARSFLKWWPSS